MLLVSLVFAQDLAVPSSTCPSETSSFGEDMRLSGAGVMVVQKEARRMGLYSSGQLLGCWEVALAYDYNPGHKQRRGDLRTPEGWYRTSDKPWSDFYGAIAVHYPGVEDAKRGLDSGLISVEEHAAIVSAISAGKKPPQNTRLGGEILIHGGGGDTDWTLGCVALENEEIDVLRAALPESKRTDVLIVP